MISYGAFATPYAGTHVRSNPQRAQAAPDLDEHPDVRPDGPRGSSPGALVWADPRVLRGGPRRLRLFPDCQRHGNHGGLPPAVGASHLRGALEPARVVPDLRHHVAAEQRLRLVQRAPRTPPARGRRRQGPLLGPARLLVLAYRLDAARVPERAARFQ